MLTRFAFVDFDSTHQATAALIEPRNQRLLGRELVLQFAGVDAVRRGASRDLLPDYVPTSRRKRRPARENDDAGNAGSASEDAPDAAAEEAPGAAEDAPEARRRARPPGRVRPGAANASAARGTYAIVPASGTRTTFE